MKLTNQLLLLIAITVAGFIISGAYGLHSLKENLIESRKHEIQSILTFARNQSLIYVNQADQGLITKEEAEKKVIELLSGIRDGASYVWSNDNNTLARVHVRAEKIGQPQSSYNDHMKLLRNQEFNFAVKPNLKPGGDVMVMKVNGLTKIPGWNWIIGYGAYMDDMDNTYWSVAFQFMLIALPILLIVAAVATYISRSILSKLGGDPDYAVSVTRKIAQGDLAEQIEGNYSEESLLGSISSMQLSLQKMVENMKASSAELSQASTDLNQQVGTIAEASRQSSDASISTAASIQELSMCIKEIALNTERTEQNSGKSFEICKNGESLISQTSEQINDISNQIEQSISDFHRLQERSNQVGSIVNVIREIADQTNLLALNAAIEAARAGDQGRGFAVVADEVRTLASRTSNATAEITETIKIIQNEIEIVAKTIQSIIPKVDESVTSSQNVTTMFNEIQVGSSDTLQMIREVAASTSEQEQASDELAKLIDKISTMVSNTSDSVGQCRHTVSELNQLAINLDQNVSLFKT